ncbi:Lrp/AsnC family transcriptional regulator [Alsobacter sp. R-9]
MDDIDCRILAILQSDASLTMAELAERVGLSPTPCWRRVQRLEEQGFISRRVALLDRHRLNAGVTVFIAVRTSRHSLDWFEQFHRALNAIPEVLEFYRLAGDIDYLIKAVVPDIGSYDALYKRIIAKVELTEVTSMFAMEELKCTTEIPLTYAPRR